MCSLCLIWLRGWMEPKVRKAQHDQLKLSFRNSFLQKCQFFSRFSANVLWRGLKHGTIILMLLCFLIFFMSSKEGQYPAAIWEDNHVCENAKLRLITLWGWTLNLLNRFFYFVILITVLERKSAHMLGENGRKKWALNTF